MTEIVKSRKFRSSREGEEYVEFTVRLLESHEELFQQVMAHILEQLKLQRNAPLPPSHRFPRLYGIALEWLTASFWNGDRVVDYSDTDGLSRPKQLARSFLALSTDEAMEFYQELSNAQTTINDD